MYFKKLNFNGVEYPMETVIVGDTDPDGEVEGNLGQLYFNSATGIYFKCTHSENGVYTWEKNSDEVIVVNGDPSNGTRINITTTDEDIEIPTMDDLNDVKKALNGGVFVDTTQYSDTSNYDRVPYTISASNTITRNSAGAERGYASIQISVNSYSSLKITANSGKNANVTFVTEKLGNLSSGTDISNKLAQNETGRHIITAGNTDILFIPANSVYAVISVRSDATTDNTAPSGLQLLTKINEELAGKQDLLTFDNAPTEDSDNPVKSGGVYDAIQNTNNVLSFVSKNHTLLDLGDYETINCNISSSNTYTRSASHYQSKQIPRDELWSYIKVTAGSVYSANVTFVTERIPLAPTQYADMSGILATGENGRHMISPGLTGTLAIPSNTAYIIIGIKSNDVDITPTSVDACGSLQEMLIFDDAPAENSENPVTSGGIYDSVIAKITYSCDFDDFVQKNVNSTTGKLSNTGADHMITNGKLIPTSSVYRIDSNYNNIRFFMYDESGAFIGGQAMSNHLTIGDMRAFAISNPTATNLRIRFGLQDYPVSIDPESEHYYANTENSISIILYKEMDDKSSSGEDKSPDENEMPSYYDRYLSTVEAKITAIQNSISDNSDAFLFITDYHTSSNCGNSLKMIRHVSRMTGITSMLFSGDANGGTPTSLSDAELRVRKSTKVWDDLQREIDAFWGVLGNHEWISMSYINRSAILGAYLNRFKLRCGGMNAYGDYWWDNPINKIRYIGIQQTSAARVEADQLDWLGDVLSSTPNGSHVLLFAHHGYIPNESSSVEYDGVTISGANYGSEGGSHLWAKRMNKILNAYEQGRTLTLTIDGTAHNFDFVGKTGYVIGVFCGHYHHGTLFEKNDTYNDEHITVFRGSADTLKAATVTTDLGLPWYWEDGTVGGTKVEREAGSTDEQCFYAVQIDLDAKKVYITAVGGDHDWEFEYGD